VKGELGVDIVLDAVGGELVSKDTADSGDARHAGS
jgi:hypothetical protein